MNDYELVYLAQEQNEEAQNYLYQKYDKLIKLLISKKYNAIKILNIDIKDIHNECLNGLNDAINKYNESTTTSFVTFATVVIRKRINYYIKRRSSIKEQYYNKSLPLDYSYEKNPFQNNFINKKDPLLSMVYEEKNKELINCISKKLSTLEYEVYALLLENFKYNDIAKILNKNPKQIDNAIQRIKNKLKTIPNLLEIN